MALPRLAVPWIGLQCVIVVFPDHAHLNFCYAVLSVLSSFAAILPRKRELIVQYKLVGYPLGVPVSYYI